ncbi:unnamed protein product [Mytilus coruscus]|uniref:Uncharacterized protein n=1 Tax=Mytilus coruscus TaxID=42192 RepID=A0A6J8EXQ0_MYTCO|nr:unnamed protein product [Mytilus coruscus]
MPIIETTILLTHTQWPSIRVAMNIESYQMRRTSTSLTSITSICICFNQHVLESIRKNYQPQICHTDESELKKKGCDEHIVKEQTTQKLQSVGNVEEKKDDSITENSKFELATYLALNYPRLCDVSQDASSLLHDTVEFVSNYRHDIEAWFHSDVLNLITCYKERRGEMGNPTMKKIEVWARISQDMNVLGTRKQASASKPSTAPAELPEDKDKLPKAALVDKPEEPKKKKKKKLAPTWMEEFIQENHQENERRREEFQEFCREFLDLQREKNDILKSLISNIQK